MAFIIQVLEYIGVFAFAVSGAIVAIQENFDLFGISCVAMVTAMGGGVLRDIVADIGVPLFFRDWTTLPIIFAAVALACLLGNRWKFNRLFVAVDALGLSAFVVSAGLKAIHSHYNLLLFLFASGITGVGGGILRDIIVNRKPAVFQSDIYTVAGLLGALTLWILYPLVGAGIATPISLALIFFVRMICYINGVNLPSMHYHQTEQLTNVEEET